MKRLAGKIQRKFLFERLCPHLMVASVLDIDGYWLKERGVKGVLIDLDNTLLARDGREVPPDVVTWINALKRQGFKVCIISNNWSRRAQYVAEQLVVQFVAPALKPFRKAFRRGLAALGTAPNETAIIGDQMFTDILGGQRLGLVTVLVEPVSDADLWHTRLLRVIERRVIASLVDGGWLISRPNGGKARAAG